MRRFVRFNRNTQTLLTVSLALKRGPLYSLDILSEVLYCQVSRQKRKVPLWKPAEYILQTSAVAANGTVSGLNSAFDHKIRCTGEACAEATGSCVSVA